MYRESEKKDAFVAAMEMASEVTDEFGMVGYGVVELRDHDGVIQRLTPFANLITDAGDLYYATKGIVGISPANATAPTPVNGMKLGTGTTAATKAGAASFIGTFITGSNLVFDASFPAVVNLGAGLGVNSQYKTTWGAGVATNAAITEATIVTDQATGTGGAAASTISRSVFSAQNKGASDTLAITWNHKNLGV